MNFISISLLVVLSPLVLTSEEHLVEEVFKAIRNEKYDALVRILKENGENLKSFINLKDKKSGQTPLMMAVLMGRDEAVKTLLARDEVDVTIPEKDGYNPLHGAGFQVSFFAVKLKMQVKTTKREEQTF